MKVTTVLDQIENGQITLPEFQRGYVWNRDQVRGLVRSLYKRYPMGSMLAWNTDSSRAKARGVEVPGGGQQVKMLLDGQQRMTSLFGIIKGKEPAFFDGNPDTFRGLYFNVETEEFSFFMPSKMKDDPLWIDVTGLMRHGPDGFLQAILQRSQDVSLISRYSTRLNRLRDIREIDVHIEDVSGEEMTLDVVVDIFNRVNSGGRQLSKGDLALAKICSVEPQARAGMRRALDEWQSSGFSFSLDWLLRNVTTIATDDARFTALHELDASVFTNALQRAVNHVNTLLDLLDARLGLDHDQVLRGHFGFPILVRLLDDLGGEAHDASLQNRILFWYVQAAIWGRYSGSTESVLSRDLNILLESAPKTGIDALIRELQLWRGSLQIRPEHFMGSTRGNRFYFILYMLTRVGESRDWGLGIPLKKGMLGKNASLEVHHVFPRAYLKKQGVTDSKSINALANFCFLTKNTNLRIRDRAPEEYFREVEEHHPGALESQWIPMDESLWRAENYRDFLAERQRLLAKAANEFVSSLHTIDEGEQPSTATLTDSTPSVPGGISDAEEETRIDAINEWVREQGLPVGNKEYEVADRDTGEVVAILDLAWPDGLQDGLSEPVALLLGEEQSLVKLAAKYNFLVFEDPDSFKAYTAESVLGDSRYGLPKWAEFVEDSALAIARHIVKSKLPEPECGVEVQSEDERVVGEFEVAWPSRKIAVWSPGNVSIEAKRAASDWMTFTVEEVIESPGLLNTALGH